MFDTLDFYGQGYNAGRKGVEYTRRAMAAQNDFFRAGYKAGLKDRRFGRACEFIGTAAIVLLCVWIGVNNV